jgi:hypothetical protein
LNIISAAQGITVKGGVQPSFRFEYMRPVPLKISRFENFLSGLTESTYKERANRVMHCIEKCGWWNHTISSYCLHQSKIIYAKDLIVSLGGRIAFVKKKADIANIRESGAHRIQNMMHLLRSLSKESR